MKFELRRLSHALGAEVIGLDLAEPLDEHTVGRLRKAWLDHHVLLFRDQALSPADHIRFTEYLGPVDDYPLVHFRHPDNPKLMVLSSDPGKGNKSTTRAAGQRWHSDLSFTPRPATGSMLHAQRIPPIGGDTMFANQIMAYEALSPAMRRMIEPLETVHELFSKRTDLAELDAAKMREMKLANPPVAQPMVRVHPETGRPALYVSPSLSTRIVGMTVEESAGLLDFLSRHCTRHEFVYRHVWRNGDLVLWDNRCLLHIAVQDYDRDSLRLMHRTTITGEPCGRLLGDENVTAAAPSAQQVALANS
jgi:taurine dioxygenase